MRKIIAALCCAMLWPQSALAICRLPAAKLCQVLFDSDIAFHGRVRKVVPIINKTDDPDGLGGWLYEVDVIKLYRGTAFNRVTIKSENSSGRLLLSVGRDYILFGAATAEPRVFEAWNNCEGIQGVDGEPFSKALVNDIYKALASKTSSIEGEVLDRKWESEKSVPITIAGNGVERTVVTDQSGRFQLTVSPGQYQLSAPPAYQETSYSHYGVPENPIFLLPGQCAQIQLQLQLEPHRSRSRSVVR